ncbi:MAG TPA: hypothetical protein PLG39_04600, partial [Methanotrichaceae archaeon]|nr:hypothetical protein [Methanotrichaceae archaeon]
MFPKEISMVYLILCLLFSCSHAIEIGFSAGDNGEYVGISDDYQVDEEVEVREEASAGFGASPSISDSRIISGTGDAKIRQSLSGRGGGADYSAASDLDVTGAASLQYESSASISPASCQLSGRTLVIDGQIAQMGLHAHQGEFYGGVSSRIEQGDLRTMQSLSAGSCVDLFQEVDALGDRVQTNAWFSGFSDGVVTQGHIKLDATGDAMFKGYLKSTSVGQYAGQDILIAKGNKVYTEDFRKKGDFEQMISRTSKDGSISGSTRTVDDGQIIQDAIDFADDGDTISIWKGVYEGNISIDKSLLIEGNGSDSTFIDGGAQYRNILVGSADPLAIVTLSKMSIRNGSATFGAGILNYADLSVIDCNITQNVAAGAGGDRVQGSSGYGGGIYNKGRLSLIESSVTANLAQGGNGTGGAAGGDGYGGDAFGGGLFNDADGVISLFDSGIVENTAIGGDGIGSNGYGGDGLGGGIFSQGTISAMTNIDVTGNIAQGGTGNGGSSNIIGSNGYGGDGLGGGIFSQGTISAMTNID